MSVQDRRRTNIAGVKKHFPLLPFCPHFPVLHFQLTGYNLVVAAWLSGNALVSINVVALRRARLVLGWVTVRGYIPSWYLTKATQVILSLAIPTWVGTMSTGGGPGHR